MAELKDHVQNGLDEARILVLGAQVVLGAQFQAIFQPSFDKLPMSSQYVVLSAFAPMLVGLGLLLVVVPYHQLVAKAGATLQLHRFITRVLGLALLPLSLSLGLDLYVVTDKVLGNPAGLLAGIAATGTALLFWYGIAFLPRPEEGSGSRRAGGEGQAMDDEPADTAEEGTELQDKIRQVLTEARVVLPGVQALLGFGFSMMLTDVFDRLPASSKYVHLGSLMMIALAGIFLIAPAAYHRIAENGENTERLHRFAARMILAALVPIALGISGDIYVVTRQVTGSVPFALAAGGLSLAFFYGLWFGFTLYQRGRLQQEAK
ncbi:MAG TPA: DUF6328 family protein [Chloroflexia bacterium]|nr:DUF6328 family protein [Chloroflexia bacterium]